MRMMRGLIDRVGGCTPLRSERILSRWAVGGGRLAIEGIDARRSTPPAFREKNDRNQNQKNEIR